MKITIFRKQKNGSESIANEEFESFMTRLLSDTREEYILRYRDVYPRLDGVGDWVYIDRIPTFCPSAEYYKNKSGQRVFRLYNGVSVLRISGLNNALEIENAKRQAALFPQTLCAMQGAEGHSLLVWTLATLPDGSLPKDEEAAKLFCAQAYATSVMCYQPTLEFCIEVEEPSIDKRFLLTVDEKPYINPHPTPFIIEQPTDTTIRSVIKQGDPQNDLDRLKPSAEAYVTFTNIFEAAYKRATLTTSDWKNMSVGNKITRIADVCADAGLPEEEVTERLLWHFYKEDTPSVRAIVNSVYSDKKGLGARLPMSKHQVIAFRLREFLKRRYEIRYNEVLQMTEYRERMSLRFIYKELDRRELNSIHHEACLEGIEPTFSEVENLVNSNFTPRYNPITEYLDNLPTWDGKDRMNALAQMVPNDNPYWDRLFTRWFLSMVAHWMNCDSMHANQTAPILIGAQGFRKSTFCRTLLPPELQQFFTDSIDFRSNVEAERCLGRFLLVNIDEFDQLNERQFAFVKHLFQKPNTNHRRMYSETIGTQRRYASFIGTSNHDEILCDPTGNRRYLCVNVTAPIHVEQAIDYRQLYAQAKHLILHGERFYLNDEDEAIIRLLNEQFEVETPIEELFLAAFSVPTSNDSPGQWLTTTQILECLMSLPTFNRSTDRSPSKLGKVLKKLNLQKRRMRHGYEYYVKRN